MATTKKTGTKKTTTRNAAKTAKAGATRVTAKSMAADIIRRTKRNPDFWVDVKGYVGEGLGEGRISRAAQVMPRETPATH
jgi:hypothetical protein